MIQPGYVYSREFFEKIAKKLRSEGKAKARILEALRHGEIVAVGYPVVSYNWGISIKFPIEIDKLTPISLLFWKLATEGEIAGWSWKTGSFRVSNRKVNLSGSPNAFQDVQFEVAALDRLIKGDPRGRKRAAQWDDWIAAISVLAINGDIDGNLTVTKLYSRIADQLIKWDLEEMPRTTVESAMKAVLKRFKDEGV